MNKILGTLCLSCGLAFGVVISASAQQIEWDYPVKAGTPAWSKLSNVDERIKACQIPIDLLSKLSTSQLLSITKSHPFFRSYVFSNSPIEGFRSSMKSFNGYQELLKRPDALTIMMRSYETEKFSQLSSLKTDIEKGQYSLTVLGVELMMSNEELISNATESNRKSFLAIVQAKRDEKSEYQEYMGGISSVTTAFLASKLMAGMSDIPKASSVISGDRMASFQSRMVPFDKDIVDEILTRLSLSVKSFR